MEQGGLVFWEGAANERVADQEREEEGASAILYCIRRIVLLLRCPSLQPSCCSSSKCAQIWVHGVSPSLLLADLDIERSVHCFMALFACDDRFNALLCWEVPWHCFLGSSCGCSVL